MKKAIKRFLSAAVLSATLVIICLFGGCSKHEANENNETEDTTHTVSYISGENAEIRIIRPDNCSQEIKKEITEISEKIKSATGLKVTLGTDWKKKNESYDSSSFEILVGKTAYPETKEALSAIGYGDYTVTLSGNKLVASGWTEETSLKAIEELTSYIENNVSEIGFPIDNTLFLTGTVNPDYNKMPASGSGEFSGVTKLHDGSLMFTVDGTEKDEFDNFTKRLTEKGYSLFSENTIAENRFSVYGNGSEYISVSRYADTDRMAFTLIDGDTPLPSANTDPVKKVCDPSLTLLGVEVEKDDNNGLGIIILLEDGTFLIVDGGYQRNEDATNLYAALCKLAPDRNNIVISAWIFTHAHGDHCGAFMNFTSMYNKKVTVKNFIIAPAPGNFPESKSGMDKTVKRLFGNYKDSVAYQARTGQKYSFGGAEIEFYFTPENLFPEKNYKEQNTNSLVFSVSLAGEKILILGDADDMSMRFMLSAYGNILKSDIMQAAHHGAAHGDDVKNPDNNIIERFYKTVDPETVLWPTSNLHYTEWVETKLRVGTDFLIDGTRTQIVSADKNKTIDLPYNK